MKLNMYIPVRDETNYMINLYQYLFNKYWDDNIQVYFLGYSTPQFKLEKNIHFISLAEKRDPSPNSWSNGIIDYFESIEDEYFHFSLEDLLIIRPVDLELIERAKEMMGPSVGRIDLWNSVQFGHRYLPQSVETHGGIVFAKEDQNPPPRVYRISCSNSIWNRKWFLKTLERDWSVHCWETKGNDGRNNNDGYDVLTTIDRWTPSVVHALSGKTWGNRVNIDGMLPDDRDELSRRAESMAIPIHFFEFKRFNQVINLRGYQPRE